MDKNETTEREGERIIRELGHGVQCRGYYLDKFGHFFTHEFFDEQTGGFTARSLTEARTKLVEIRGKFKKPVPVFR